MKIFLVFWFVFLRLALASGWILYEDSSPSLSTNVLLRRRASNIAPLNLPERQVTRSERMCSLKGSCNRLYYRSRSEIKQLFQPTPTFRRSYGSLYPPKMKGRQANQQRRERFYSGRSFIYMAPNVMIVRPVNVAHERLPPQRAAYSGLRGILFSRAPQTLEPKTERLINKDQGLLREFSDKPTSSKETSTTAENRTVVTETSPRGAKKNSTFPNNFHAVQRNTIQAYAVREVVDEGEPAAGEGRNGSQGKPLSRHIVDKEGNAESRRKSSYNSRIVKIIPLVEREKTTEKIAQNATTRTYKPTTNHLRIVPSQHSQGLIQKSKELTVNRKEQSKNLKIATNHQENSSGVTANTGNRTNPIPNSGIKNGENSPAIEMTPSNGIGTLLKNATAETKHISNLDEIRGRVQKANRKVSPSLPTESELPSFKPQPTLLPGGGERLVASSKTGSTPDEDTFTVLDVENVTYVTEDPTVTWKFQNNPSPMEKVLNTTDQVTTGNFTTSEGFTDRPSTPELPKPRKEVKDRESLSKNSRKMHFGQDSRPNEVLGPGDQRRSDILISDNLDDYFDDEYYLSYLEKLKRNNSVEGLKNLTSASLIPLIPMVIQDLRQGKIPPEDISLLSFAFRDIWPTVLELSNSTNIDMLPILKMKDESDLKKVLQSIQSYSVEATTIDTTVSVDYDSYDYMEKFKDLYEDLLAVGQELEVDEGTKT